MSKKTLLSESQIRQFMKLAKLEPMTPGFVEGLTESAEELEERGDDERCATTLMMNASMKMRMRGEDDEDEVDEMRMPRRFTDDEEVQLDMGPDYGSRPKRGRLEEEEEVEDMAVDARGRCRCR